MWVIVILSVSARVVSLQESVVAGSIVGCEVSGGRCPPMPGTAGFSSRCPLFQNADNIFVSIES